MHIIHIDHARLYTIVYHTKVHMTMDALKMRVRRLCEKKPSGRLQVPEEIAAQWKQGGEARETLEMALLESLSKNGLDRSNYKKVKARPKTCKNI